MGYFFGMVVSSFELGQPSVDVAACVGVTPRNEVGSGLAAGWSIAGCQWSLTLLHLAMIYSSSH
jgi:hypothetical protein